MRIEEGFQQTPLQLPLPYSSDHHLQAVLQRMAGNEVGRKVDEELRRFEQRVAGPIRDLASVLDSSPSTVKPTLIQYSHFGQRVDKLATHEAWRKLKDVYAEEGLVSIAFERKEGPLSRIVSFAKTYLFVPDSLYVGCPGSMTDGCARVLELAGTEEMKREVLPRLTSRDPATAFTAGQWMTERPGGSDVSLTETVARPVNSSKAPEPGDPFVLDGFKWFSSATDGDVALALARTGGPGSKGLSLFLVNLRNKDGSTNGVYVHRLKKKMGTLALPTAELELKGCIGHLVGPLGSGVRTISTVLNITRLHSSVSSVAQLRRGLDLAKAFARVRHVAGDPLKMLCDNEMHTSSLAKIEVTHRAVLGFFFATAGLLGRSEALAEGTGQDRFTEEEKWRLRLLTPVLKTFSAELCTTELPRCMEALGGQGYMRETQFARLIADANVERIWEGTTSVLALDVIRVITQSKGLAIESLLAWAHTVLPLAERLFLPSSTAVDTLTARLALLTHLSSAFLSPSPPPDARFARPLLFHLGYLASALHLLEHAAWSASNRSGEAETDARVFRTWVNNGGARETERELRGLLEAGEDERRKERALEGAAVYGSRGVERESKL
ncbi:hypothetical protein JCM10207_003599 [Rhodosporidiobolus poonsookiae]